MTKENHRDYTDGIDVICKAGVMIIAAALILPLMLLIFEYFCDKKTSLLYEMLRLK